MAEPRTDTATLIRAGRLVIARHIRTADGVAETAMTEAVDRLEEFHIAACLFREAQQYQVGDPRRLPIMSKACAALAGLA